MYSTIRSVAVVLVAATAVVGFPAIGNAGLDLPDGLPIIPTIATRTIPSPTRRPIVCPLDAAGCPPGPIVEGPIPSPTPIDGMNPGPVTGGSGTGPIDGMNPGPVIVNPPTGNTPSTPVPQIKNLKN